MFLFSLSPKKCFVYYGASFFFIFSSSLSLSRFRVSGANPPHGPPTAALAVETCGVEEEAGWEGFTFTFPSAYGAVPEGGTATLRTSKGPPAIALALWPSIMETTAGSRFEPVRRVVFLLLLCSRGFKGREE